MDYIRRMMLGLNQGQDDQRPKAQTPQFTRQNNSDWNKVVQDTDRNLFFAV